MTVPRPTTVSSRYDLGEEHARDKERYAAKEREEVIRRSKERRVAETKVCCIAT